MLPSVAGQGGGRALPSNARIVLILRDPTPGASEKAETDERERMVAAAVDKLPARQRSAIMLTYSEGMSNAQVAEILDTSVSAVETLLIRGKQNLRRALGGVIDKED